MPFWGKKGLLLPWACSIAEKIENGYQKSAIYKTLCTASDPKGAEPCAASFSSQLFLYLAGAFLLFFPFLFLTGHAAILCLGFVLVLDGWWLWERRGDAYSCSFCERTALLLSLFFLLGGFFGAGAPADGLIAAIGVTVIFPMRHAARLGKKTLHFCMQIGSIAASLYGIWQYFFGDLPLLWTDTERFSDIGSRVSSFFGNPNILGVYLLLSLPCALVGIFESSRKKRFFSCISAMLILLCLVFTWSRGAWLGAICEIFLVLLCTSRQSRVALILSPAVLAALLPFLPGSIYNRFSGIASLGDSSVQYRRYSWQGILRMIEAHPFGIGVGEEAFLSVYPAFAVSGTERVMHAHNIFLQLCTEIGIPGLFAFLLFLASLLLPALGGRREKGAAIAICGACVMGMFDHLWYARGMLVLFFSVTGMSLGE